MVTARYRIEWITPIGTLVAATPDLATVRAAAPMLAAGYNDPANAPLMGHTELLDEADVVESYEDMLADAHARTFLFTLDGVLVGDGDLRHIQDGADGGAEFAFMIAAPAHQGKGLGTKLALMICAFGFRACALANIYGSIVPHNVASRRVFEKLGFRLDTSPAARAFADAPTDDVMAIDRASFEQLHAAALAELTIAEV